MNPYAPPGATAIAPQISEDAAGALLEDFTIDSPAPAGRFRVSFHEHAIVAVRGDGARFALTRSDLVEHTDLVLGSLAQGLVIRHPARAFIPVRPIRAPLRRFLEPVRSAHLAATLKRRVKLSLPIGLFIALTSLPLLLAATDVRGLVLGISMVLVALAARVIHHRALFLADAVVWLMIAASNALHLAGGGSPVLFGAFAVLGVLFAIGSVRLFAFYATP